MREPVSPVWLLLAHQHVHVVFRCDQMAVIVVADAQFHPLDLAVEHRILALCLGLHRCTKLAADIKAFGCREDHRLRDCHRPFANLVAVVEERNCAAFRQSAARIGKLHADLMLASR